ncbi:MAG TPA: hypothetical protein VH877_11220 [Polyangia bacterium]|nr:hypothetical protein [Polyangia bacterium]
MTENDSNRNLLNMNALNMNALNMNALNLNALNINALDPAAALTIRSPGPKGDLARQLVRYAVGCALSPSQSFSFSWTDGTGTVHDEVYLGQLGLAPTWATAPLTSSGARWVSACLASRVNYYGTPVPISSRAPGVLTTSSSERGTYAYEEGAFWGNVFGPTPAVFACYDLLTTSHSRARARDCAAGHADSDGYVEQCGIIQIVGPCTTSCLLPLLEGDGYSSCGSLLSKTSETITVFLQ